MPPDARSRACAYFFVRFLTDGRCLRRRTLAVRAFDASAMMTGWELIEGAQLEAAIEKLFADPRAAYLHVHFAAPGCYAAHIERA